MQLSQNSKVKMASILIYWEKKSLKYDEKAADLKKSNLMCP